MQITLVTLVGYAVTTLAQMLEHYTTIGVTAMLIYVHDSPEHPEVLDHVRAIAPTCAKVIPLQGDWLSIQYQTLARNQDHPDDWFILADQDEFQLYPDDLPRILAECDRRHVDHLRGCLIDRLAEDGTLSPLRPNVPLFSQYPIGCLVTGPVCRGNFNKVVAAKGRVEWVDEGHHQVVGGRPYPIDSTDAIFVEVHHFKWIAGLLDYLNKRHSNAKYGATVQDEGRRFIEYYRSHGNRVELSDPMLMAERCNPRYPNFDTVRRMIVEIDLAQARKATAHVAHPVSLHAPPRAHVPLRKLLDLSLPIKIVDIGANPIGGPAPYAGILKEGNAHVVGFEPNLNALEVLRSQESQNETYLSCAIADGQQHTLNHCATPGMTSLLNPNPAILSRFHDFTEWSRVVRTEEIETMRLDDIPETYAADLLKLDIQGAELMALQNAPNRLSDALVIQTEVEFLPMYINQPLFHDVASFLHERGFMLHRFYPLVSRSIKPLLLPIDSYRSFSQVLWADAIFVRDFTRLDLLTNDQLMRMATILSDCYKSFDLVMYILLEADCRMGTTHSKTFLRHLSDQT